MSPTLKSFAQDTADKLRVSSRTVERTVQMMNGLTQDTREVFRGYPKYKLSQSNAMKLSRMEPGRQKTTAILLASGQIQSADEYQPVCAASGDTDLVLKEKMGFLEGIADLKDPTKDCGDTSENFVAEYAAFLESFQRSIETFRMPNYAQVFPDLSQEQLQTLKNLTDFCCKTLGDYYSYVKESSANV